MASTKGRVYRRVTRAENEAAWKARRYTAAAPGKFRKASKTVSFRQVQQTAHGGKSIEKQIKERRSAPNYLSSVAHQRVLKAQETRARRKEFRQMQEQLSLLPGEAEAEKAVLEKYLKKGGYNSLTDDEKKLFHEMFVRYPEDLLRKWYGSSEASRSLRRAWASYRTTIAA